MLALSGAANGALLKPAQQHRSISGTISYTAPQEFGLAAARAFQADGLVEVSSNATGSSVSMDGKEAEPAPFKRGLFPSASPPSGISFLVIGPQKTGTSALWEYLMRHPQLQLNRLKELLHFNNNGGIENCTDGKKNSYLNRFIEPEHGRHTGDFSATDASCVCCPAVVKSLLPDVKLIALVRNPIQRALSRYDEQVKFRNAERFVPNSPVGLGDSFAGYVDSNLPILERCLDDAGDDVRARALCAHSDPILGYSLYEASLSQWMQSFSKDRLLVLSSETLASRPLDELRRVEEHLLLGKAVYPEAVVDGKYNSGDHLGWGEHAHAVASHTTDRGTFDRLTQFYEPHQRLLGARFGDQKRV